MEAPVRELLDLLVRWIHIIAGIMWIGNSLLFNWLDRNLIPPDPPNKRIHGKIWLLHSGAFYEVEKKLLAPGEMPDQLHWFMWQNFTTWASGIGLLIIVYYMGGAAYMVDPSVADVSFSTALMIGIGTLIAAWFVYDLIWNSPLRSQEPVAAGLSLTLLLIVTFGLTQVLSGRAAYIHVGVLLGTLMTGNVWFYIVPSQRKLVAATLAGQPQDPAISYRAKQRSIHNNYMTFPLLFIMISNHFPSTYASELNWLILAVLMVGSALVRHYMNIRFHYRGWLRDLTATAILSLAILVTLISWGRGVTQIAASGPPVTFAEARNVIQLRCISCHSATPTDDQFTAPPAGVVFDTPQQIKALAARIKERAVNNKSMPFGNKTNMTEEERALLGRWIDQGAPIE